MNQIQVPAFPIPDNTTFGDIPMLCSALIDGFEQKGISTPPVLMFEVCDKPQWKHEDLRLSEAPERMVFVAPHVGTRDTIMAALKEVEKREPPMSNPRPPMDFTVKPNTPLKQIFKRMTEAPVTVLSMTMADEMEFTIFFLRTAFTISELRKEIPQHVIR